MKALYFAPGACSFVPHVGLERIREVSGADYEARMIKLHKGEQKTPEFLALNPDGQVPVLVGENKPLTQLLAICEHLDRSCPEAGLLPADGAARDEALSTLIWMNNTVHPTFTHVFMPFKFTDDADAQAKVKTFNVEKYRMLLKRLDELAGERAQLWCGTTLTLVDAYAFTLLRWGGMAGVDPESVPKLKALVERALAQPAMATVAARERVALDTYKP